MLITESLAWTVAYPELSNHQSLARCPVPLAKVFFEFFGAVWNLF